MTEIALGRVAVFIGLFVVLGVFGFLDPALIAMSRLEPGTWGEWAGAIGTLLAVLFALYHQWLIPRSLKPRLSLGLHLVDDCGRLIIRGQPLHYFRLRVENLGSCSARGVLIRVRSIIRLEEGSRSLVEGFLPFDLDWNQGGQSRVDISAGKELGELCDLARIPRDTSSQLYPEAATKAANDQRQRSQWPLALESATKFSDPFELLWRGDYEIRLLLAAENHASLAYLLRVKWDGVWRESFAETVGKPGFMQLEALPE